jgi:hypothetical protein
MAVSPVAQAAYRSRAYAAAELPLAPPSTPAVRVLVVDRWPFSRKLLNVVRAQRPFSR